MSDSVASRAGGIAPFLFCEDVPLALEWLVRAFGLRDVSIAGLQRKLGGA